VNHQISAKAAAIAADPNNHTIEERLAALLSGPGQLKRLGQAIHTAATQLELLTPAAMMAGPAGLLAGPVAMVATGSVLLVMAKGRLCVTSHWGVAEGASLADALTQCIQIATDLNAPDGAAPFLVQHVVQHVVQRYGAGPGQPPPPGLASVDMRPVLGALLAMLEKSARSRAVAVIEHIRCLGVCPALVAVVGPSSSHAHGTISFAGPIILPLARYAQAAADLADSRS
jgi:hypothetical protein